MVRIDPNSHTMRQTTRNAVRNAPNTLPIRIYRLVAVLSHPFLSRTLPLPPPPPPSYHDLQNGLYYHPFPYASTNVWQYDTVLV